MDDGLVWRKWAFFNPSSKLFRTWQDALQPSLGAGRKWHWISNGLCANFYAIVLCIYSLFCLAYLASFAGWLSFRKSFPHWSFFYRHFLLFLFFPLPFCLSHYLIELSQILLFLLSSQSLVADTHIRGYVRPSVHQYESKSGATSVLEVFCVCVCVGKGFGWGVGSGRGWPPLPTRLQWYCNPT